MSCTTPTLLTFVALLPFGLVVLLALLIALPLLIATSKVKFSDRSFRNGVPHIQN